MTPEEERLKRMNDLANGVQIGPLPLPDNMTPKEIAGRRAWCDLMIQVYEDVLKRIREERARLR